MRETTHVQAQNYYELRALKGGEAATRQSIGGGENGHHLLPDCGQFGLRASSRPTLDLALH